VFRDIARAVTVPLAVALALAILLVLFAWVNMGPDKRQLRRDIASGDIGFLDEAVKSYHDTVGSYPPNLRALLTAPADLPPGRWGGPYLKRDISLDPWGNTYQYSSPGKHNPEGVDIWTFSPDGQEIGNWIIRKGHTTVARST